MLPDLQRLTANRAKEIGKATINRIRITMWCGVWLIFLSEMNGKNFVDIAVF